MNPSTEICASVSQSGWEVTPSLASRAVFLAKHYQAVESYTAAAEAVGRAVEIVEKLKDVDANLLLEYADSLLMHARMDEQVAVMKSIWAQNPPFDGVDPVGPVPVQEGGPTILTGAMGPKGLARSAHWADGVYAFSGNGEQVELEKTFAMTDEAWDAAGRSETAYRLGGFWYSLADDGAAKLYDYVYNYLQIAGDDVAKWMADSVHRSDTDAVKEALDNAEAAGCEEAMLSPVTAELCEIDRLVDILESR